MKKILPSILAGLIALLTVFSTFSAAASALLDPGYKVKITAPETWLAVGGFMQLTATISTPADCTAETKDFAIKWSSLDENSSVNQDGLLYGKKAGQATVKVDVTEPVTGEIFSDTVTIHITTFVDAVNNILVDNTILGFRFNKNERFYYYDQDKAWQKHFGFINAFDMVSPYMTLEYDYIRVHYNYGGKARMVQLWKGQYGIMFYGDEIGYYYRDKELAPNEEVTALTHFKCASDEEDKIGMQSTLYWDYDRNGIYQYQFTVPYDKYWWATGFRMGHLWETEPADELRMEGFIDFHDEEEAQAFCEGFEKCGFSKEENASTLSLDSYSVNDNRVNFRWQNISEAESTKVTKSTVTALFTTGGIAAIFMLIGFFMLSLLSTGALFFLIVLI